MTAEEKKKALIWFADGFDLYLEGRLPAGGEDDILSQYVRDVIDRNPNLGSGDPLFCESFKDNLMSFLSDMIDKFDAIDRGTEQEKLLQRQFMKSSVGERRAMWKQVSNFTREKYSPLDLNTEGYSAQLEKNNAGQIFDMFMKEWKDASDKRSRLIKNRLLASASTQWERICQQKCQADYLERNV